VFPRRLIGSWNDYDWEQRLFLKLIGERDLMDTIHKANEGAQRMQTDKKYARRIKRYGRIRADLPLIAIVMMLIGFFLCFNYSAF
jgi:hypothetical protein